MEKFNEAKKPQLKDSKGQKFSGNYLNGTTHFEEHFPYIFIVLGMVYPVMPFENVLSTFDLRAHHCE